ncbi:MAG TPA: hypothetical protein VFK58_08320, partial [Sphingomicrobium sp.]|nr:hypothetical protein [Sphingomicrobium sp.]
LHMGIADVEELPGGVLMRKPFPPYVQRLRHWQQRLGRVTVLDDDPFDSAVSLDDVRSAAAELRPVADADWS